MRKSNVGTQRPGVLRPRNSDATPNNRSSGGQVARKSFLAKPGQVERTRRGSSNGSNRPSASGLRFTPTRNNAYGANLLGPPSSTSRPSPAARNSSMGTVSRKEMRPITDSSFKSRCIDKIISFLVTNGYDLPVERRTLLTPSAKDFGNIFQFIYRHLDNSYQLQSKFEDEIPRILKALTYPVQMPKSSFITVGSPHTWPSVLAMLDWLIEVINNSNDMDVESLAFPEEFDSDMCQQRIRIETDIKLFHCDTEQDIEDCHEEFRHNIERLSKVRPQDMIASQEQMEQIEDEIGALNSQEEREAELKQQYSQMLNDIEKLNGYCLELEAFNANKDAEIVKQKQTLEGVRSEFKQLNEDIVHLTQLKNEQGLSAAELTHFKNHAREGAVVTQQLQLQSKDLDTKIWNKEMEIGKTMKSLNENICMYNGLVSQLELSNDYEATSVINSDNLYHLQNNIIALLRTKKKNVKHDAFQTQDAKRQKEDELYMTKEMLQEKSVEVTKLESKLKRLEDDKLITKKEVQTEKQEMLQESECHLEQIKEERKSSKSYLYQKQRAIEQSKEEQERIRSQASERARKGIEFLVKVNAVARDHLIFNGKESLKFKKVVDQISSDIQDVVKDSTTEKQK
ncbi:hypothetical protein Pmani_013154 [Petrolisthes manimaculis]|uniref:Kinetochore protein NDC80 n=1 Tax=Petrolisthes manimaculis TaxID=1843537 RepID=A0AAE1PXU3_9EUCA|nr:hypothetical protein Pmani_013154 [Petrolisthes manimaculis]